FDSAEQAEVKKLSNEIMVQRVDSLIADGYTLEEVSAALQSVTEVLKSMRIAPANDFKQISIYIFGSLKANAVKMREIISNLFKLEDIKVLVSKQNHVMLSSSLFISDTRYLSEVYWYLRDLKTSYDQIVQARKHGSEKFYKQNTETTVSWNLTSMTTDDVNQEIYRILFNSDIENSRIKALADDFKTYVKTSRDNKVLGVVLARVLKMYGIFLQGGVPDTDRVFLFLQEFGIKKMDWVPATIHEDWYQRYVDRHLINRASDLMIPEFDQIQTMQVLPLILIVTDILLDPDDVSDRVGQSADWIKMRLQDPKIRTNDKRAILHDFLRAAWTVRELCSTNQNTKKMRAATLFLERLSGGLIDNNKLIALQRNPNVISDQLLLLVDEIVIQMNIQHKILAINPYPLGALKRAAQATLEKESYSLESFSVAAASEIGFFNSDGTVNRYVAQYLNWMTEFDATDPRSANIIPTVKDFSAAVINNDEMSARIAALKQQGFSFFQLKETISAVAKALETLTTISSGRPSSPSIVILSPRVKNFEQQGKIVKALFALEGAEIFVNEKNGVMFFDAKLREDGRYLEAMFWHLKNLSNNYERLIDSLSSDHEKGVNRDSAAEMGFPDGSSGYIMQKSLVASMSSEDALALIHAKLFNEDVHWNRGAIYKELVNEIRQFLSDKDQEGQTAFLKDVFIDGIKAYKKFNEQVKFKSREAINNFLADLSKGAIARTNAREIVFQGTQIHVKDGVPILEFDGGVLEGVAKNMALHDAVEKSRLNEKPAVSGGIDINSNNMTLDVAREGAGVAMTLDPAMVARFERGDFSGVVPVILKVTPISSPMLLLGMNTGGVAALEFSAHS
ncbi:MAG: hypothetical protein WCI27_05045, partial [Candidatus Omnitrophota bacterium]